MLDSRLMNSGSSPLARGPQPRSFHPARTRGLIPARAGTTLVRVGASPIVGAHPRSRGDHRSLWLTPPVGRGSSPLARGPLSSDLNRNRIVGLIPARAGTTSDRTPTRNRPRAHPRSRGDHAPPYQPLVRVGLIPARAGTTLRSRARLWLMRAHPRSRGDHAPWAGSKVASEGSSPLARGPLPEW